MGVVGMVKREYTLGFQGAPHAMRRGQRLELWARPELPFEPYRLIVPSDVAESLVIERLSALDERRASELAVFVAEDVTALAYTEKLRESVVRLDERWQELTPAGRGASGVVYPRQWVRMVWRASGDLQTWATLVGYGYREAGDPQ